MVSEQWIKELTYREKSNNPIKVAVAGTGFIGRGLINQSTLMKGIKVVAVANRTINKAVRVLEQSGYNSDYSLCRDSDELNKAIKKGKIGVVENPLLLTLTSVDIVCDCTGDPETGAALGLSAIERGIHFIACPEADTAVGPFLNALANSKGVVYTGAEGDEPAVIMNLYRYVTLIGLDIIAAGKFKKYHNPFATPASVKPWSDKYDHNPFKIASFADGSKMSIEMALVANATGLVPEIRGMHCPSASLDTVARILSLKKQGGILDSTGVVEVVRGVEPSGGVFIIASTSHPQIISDLQYLKMGYGPNYLFYRPYHLCAVEMGISIVRAVLDRDSTIAPAGPPVANVLAVAKRDLRPGEILDDIGGYTFYGLIDRAPVIRQQRLLPVAMARGTRVLKPLKKGEPITMDQVEVDYNSLLWKLYEQQYQMFCQ